MIFGGETVSSPWWKQAARGSNSNLADLVSTRVHEREGARARSALWFCCVLSSCWTGSLRSTAPAWTGVEKGHFSLLFEKPLQAH